MFLVGGGGTERESPSRSFSLSLQSVSSSLLLRVPPLSFIALVFLPPTFHPCSCCLCTVPVLSALLAKGSPFSQGAEGTKQWGNAAYLTSQQDSSVSLRGLSGFLAFYSHPHTWLQKPDPWSVGLNSFFLPPISWEFGVGPRD